MKENGMIRRCDLRPVDLITGLYLAMSGILALAWWGRLDGHRWLIPLYFAGAVLTLTAPPYLRRLHRPFGRFLSAWYPILCLTFFYTSTALLNPASPVPALDPWLADVDTILFGRPVCEAFSERFPGAFFAELMAFFYFSYYFMIPGIALWLWIKNRSLFQEFVFCVALCFYFFYLVFSLLPASGPQYYLYGGKLIWNGILFGPLLTGLLESVEVPTGAFPSSHVGIALVVTVFAWRHHRLLGGLMAGLSTGLAAAILYGGPHYFIDLPLGLAVGAAFLLLAGPCARWIEAHLVAKTEGKKAVARTSAGKD